MTHDRFIKSCPVGCAAALTPTDIVLPEGPLLRCAECGQRASSCSKEQYEHALKRFHTPEGTLPGPESRGRRDQLSERWLRKILALLHRRPQETRLLDVGCSSGALLLTARAMGFDSHGVEPWAEAAETARSAGLDVKTGFLEDAGFPDATFDALILMEVVEHLGEPRPLLAECRRVLKPGGILLVTTPNFASWTARLMGARWDGLSLTKMGGHVSFFNPGSMRLIAERAGLETARVDTRNVRFFERGQCSRAVYTLGRLGSEALNLPARLAGAGHEMHAYLRRPQAAPRHSR